MKSSAKVKMMNRYSDGGETIDYIKSTSSSSEDAAPMDKAEEAAAPEYKSFKEAFAAERKAGNKTFEYMGKKYTTDTAAPRQEAAKAASPKAATPKAESAAAPKVEKLASTSRVPTSEQAAANRSAAMEKVKGVGSAIGDYFGNLTSTSRYMNKKMNMGGAVAYANGGVVKRATATARGKAC
jgi:hypothetical protein